jgi:hypothetical protein
MTRDNDFFNTQQKICEEITKYLGLEGYEINIHNNCPASLQKEAREQRNETLSANEKLQNYEGLCVAWCLLIAHLLVLNKESSLEDIVKCMLEEKKDNLDGYIRRYLKFLENENMKQIREILEY